MPGAARSATTLVLQVLGVIVGLSLAYVLLTDAARKPRGKSAIEIFGRGIVRGLQRVVLPVDPIAGSAAVSRAKAKSDLSKLRDVPPDLRAKIEAGIDAGDPGAFVQPLVPLPQLRSRSPRRGGVGSVLPGVGSVIGK